MAPEMFQFQKEIKLKLLILILSSLSLNLLSDSVLERFNIIIKNDLTFNHRYLDSNNEVSESVGSLIHDGEVILINVDSPFKERYQISEKTFLKLVFCKRLDPSHKKAQHQNLLD